MLQDIIKQWEVNKGKLEEYFATTKQDQYTSQYLDIVKKIFELVLTPNDAKPHVGSSLSPMYRLMIYFAHSTMVMYAADIVCHDKMTVAEFREQNEAVCKRVFDEGLSIMNYELSYEQVSRACYVYLQSKYFPQSVKTSKVYTPS